MCITLVISGDIMSCLISDTADPESSLISIGTPPSRPLMMAALVLIADTIIKLSLVLSGPIAGDACGPPWAPPGHFPASNSPFEGGPFDHTGNIVD